MLAYSTGDLHTMYRFAVALVLSAGLLSTTGCYIGPPNTPPDPIPGGCGGVTGTGVGCNRLTFGRDFQDVPLSAVISNSQQFGNPLFDTDTALTYAPDSSQILVTVATDTGAIFSQSFPGVPANGST